MKEWKEKLEVFLKINEYNILKDNGTIKREIADKLALDEYNKYRVLQDKNYISDFDELVIETKKLNKKQRFFESLFLIKFQFQADTFQATY